MVEWVLWEHQVAGSSPVIPTTNGECGEIGYTRKIVVLVSRDARAGSTPVIHPEVPARCR